jgi:hypothetical protein
VRQVVLLQYGDDPEIEPGELWVRVLLAADGPEDYERSVQAFQHATFDLCRNAAQSIYRPIPLRIDPSDPLFS